MREFPPGVSPQKNSKTFKARFHRHHLGCFPTVELAVKEIEKARAVYTEAMRARAGLLGVSMEDIQIELMKTYEMIKALEKRAKDLEEFNLFADKERGYHKRAGCKNG